MRKTIPFTKDITFKTKIGEITAISLDNDLMLKGEDLISGNFYISGNYKMLETSTILEDYSYKIPCEIAISEEYDTFDATIDIDDFNYEIIDDEVLHVSIVVAIDNLKKKEITDKSEKTLEEFEPETIETLSDKEERCFDTDDAQFIDKNIIEESDTNKKNTISFLDVKESVNKQNDNYLTYKVYIFKEGDSIESILDKYQITKDELFDYNSIEDILPGSKLVIPSSNA